MSAPCVPRDQKAVTWSPLQSTAQLSREATLTTFASTCYVYICHRISLDPRQCGVTVRYFPPDPPLGKNEEPVLILSLPRPPPSRCEAGSSKMIISLPPGPAWLPLYRIRSQPHVLCPR